MTNWKNLIVTDAEGDTVGTLGDLIKVAPSNLDAAMVENGKITVWPQFFLSIEGEEPDFATPRGKVDWDGFEDILSEVRG